MKKIIALILALASILSSLFILTSCGDENETPSGMQFVAGGENLGYYFYSPEEWTISNVGEIKAAYVSRVDPTSILFTEIDVKVPEGSDKTEEEYFFDGYFEDSCKEFPDSYKTEYTVKGEDDLFGKTNEGADKAKKYIFNYTYYDTTANKNVTMGFIQYLLMKEFEGGEKRFYIFQFSSPMEIRSGNQTYYDFYITRPSEGESSKLEMVTKNFRFLKKLPPKTPTQEGNEWKLITDNAYSGYDLYVPGRMTVTEHTSIFAQASYDDGSNITMTEASETGVETKVYMIRRMNELEALVTNGTLKGEGCIVRDDKGEIIDVVPKSIKFGNASSANLYEYEFEYNGSTYQVYQILSVYGNIFTAKGYVFTYTAKKDNFNLHLEEVKEICNKVTFQ